MFRFDGKRVLVVGGASGMGEAACRILTDLGADVVVMDLKDSPQAGVDTIRVDLRSEEAIDAAVAALDGDLNAILSCAGVADQGLTQVDVFQINFVGQRHLIESLVERGQLESGSAIGMISSLAGFGWQAQLELLRELLETTSFAAASEWAASLTAPLGVAVYAVSKQAVNAYCAWRATAFGRKGIRINATAPAPTQTPLLAATPAWVERQTEFEVVMARPAATAEEQALPLVFLCSDAAHFVSGEVLHVDAGLMGGSISGGLSEGFGLTLAERLIYQGVSS
jgi:NAD(P)-dependent dehydrogenase (short-subunit alcohol dehydrogenase family)